MAKAVSTVIASILALMIVVSMSAGFYFWYAGMQSQQFGSVEKSHSTLSQRLSGTCLNVVGHTFNPLINKSTVSLQNCGKQDFVVGDSKTLDNILISPDKCSFSLSNTNCDRCPFTLKAGQIETFTLLWRYIPECQIGDLEEKELLFYVDGAAPASIRFTPESTGTCGPQIIKAITISNTTPVSGNVTSAASYQIYLTLNTSSFVENNTLRADCNDLRFLDYDAATELTFHTQTTCNNSYTRVVVNVPRRATQGGNQTIFIAYNNSGATSSKSSTDAYLFSDDFTGTVLDGTKWHTVNHTPTGGESYLDGAGNFYAIDTDANDVFTAEGIATNIYDVFVSAANFNETIIDTKIYIDDYLTSTKSSTWPVILTVNNASLNITNTISFALMAASRSGFATPRFTQWRNLDGNSRTGSSFSADVSPAEGQTFLTSYAIFDGGGFVAMNISIFDSDGSFRESMQTSSGQATPSSPLRFYLGLGASSAKAKIDWVGARMYPREVVTFSNTEEPLCTA